DLVVEVLAGTYKDAHVGLQGSGIHQLAVGKVAGVFPQENAEVAGPAGMEDYSLGIYAEDDTGIRHIAGSNGELGFRIVGTQPAERQGTGRRDGLDHVD